MTCPLCGYVMDALDTECLRCHGRGLATPTAPSVAADAGDSAEPAPPKPTPPEPAPPDEVVAAATPSPVTPHVRAVPRPAPTKWRIAVGALLLLLLAAGIGYFWWTRTPQYSLLQARNAFARHDVAAFEKYVDLDSCLDALLEDALVEARARQHGDGRASSFEKKLESGMASLAKAVAVPLLKGIILKSVENGVDSLRSDAGQLGPAAGYRKAFDEPSLRYAGIDHIRLEDHTAYVGLNLHNPREPVKSFVCELKMVDMQGYWRVTKWNNAHEIYRRFNPGKSAPAPPVTEATPVPTTSAPGPAEPVASATALPAPSAASALTGEPVAPSTADDAASSKSVMATSTPQVTPVAGAN